MDVKYKWIERKLSGKQHICRDTGETYCKAENGSKKPFATSDTPHPTRKPCGICVFLKSREERNIPPKTRLPKRKKTITDFFLLSREWREIRYQILKKNDGKCEACGRGKQDGAVLYVDHIKPRIRHPELALTVSNLQVLCAECNHGKGNWDETSWISP